MKIGDKPKFLIETALLTHGLYSVTNEEIKKTWQGAAWPVAFLYNGEIRMEPIDTYLPYRKELASYPRLDCDTLPEQKALCGSGSLTASATMAVCAEKNIPIAVTAGMGGIGDIAEEKQSADLPALTRFPVLLLATAPKDMLDYSATFDWLREHDVRVFGTDRAVADGFMFQREPVRLEGIAEPGLQQGLLLHAIPVAERLTAGEWIDFAVQAGKEAEREGREYHPAANRAFDRLSEGKSSRMQLQALIANAAYAEEL
ncbi:MAG: hypothetical protein GX291_02120 [Tissierellia bacterium]|jgi:pseudouridine-5'-phosphate glycosidase|nr:pseudouridine-5'-phosphate glycosidase [Bacillota bacterium]NLK58050.1 hypothetical protein [Tissierellia bacterium]